MTEIEIDRETTAAVEALAYRIRERDAAIHSAANDLPDADVAAREFITALRGRGWRPTPARVAKLKDQSHGGDGLPAAAGVRDLIAEARAACAVSPTRVHPAAEDGAA